MTRLTRAITGMFILVCTALCPCLQLHAEPIPQYRFASINFEAVRPVNQSLMAAYRSIGIPVAIAYFPPQRALMLACTGQYDGETARLAHIAQECPQLHRIEVPVFSLEATAFTVTATPKQKGWEGLKPYRVGVLMGTKYAEKAGKTLHASFFKDERQMLRRLHEGKIDIVVMERMQGEKLIQEMNLPHIQPLYPPLTRTPLYHYVNKRHKKLIPRITRALRMMKRDGSWQRMQRRLYEEWLRE